MLLFFDCKKKIFYSFAVLILTARVAELVDALDSKSSSFGVRVRFPPRVLKGFDRYVEAFFILRYNIGTTNVENYMNFNKNGISFN